MNTTQILTKQVILVRTDLRSNKGQKIRSGKLMAQAAHASLLALLSGSNITNSDIVIQLLTPDTKQPTVTCDWLAGLYTKVVLAVNSQQELINLIDQATQAGLLHSLVTDVGMTEFDGVPTITAGAIGPANSADIDKLTNHLSLY